MDERRTVPRSDQGLSTPSTPPNGVITGGGGGRWWSTVTAGPPSPSQPVVSAPLMRKVFCTGAALVAIGTCHAQGEMTEADKAALLAFKSSGDPDSDLLPKWTADTHPCEEGVYWEGVECASETGRVNSVSFESMMGPDGDMDGLTGDIGALAPLTALTSLTALGAGGVTGSLADLSGLTGLTTLDLRYSAVAGDIADLVQMTQLTTLWLAGAPVHGDAAVIRTAIPALADWGDNLECDLISCMFLPCETSAMCVTDRTSPAGVCGVGCSAADATLLSAATSEDEMGAVVPQLTATCLGCIQNHAHDGEIVGNSGPSFDDIHLPFADQIAAILSACPTGGGGRPGPACTSNAELDAALEAVNAECCDEPTEDCSSGYPATCNADCAAVLRPLQAACAAFLTSGGKALAPVMHLIDAAVATCPAQCEPRPVDTRGAECIAADREADEEAMCRGWNLHWDAKAKTCSGGH